MSVFRYMFHPKRAAALSIAKDMIQHWSDDTHRKIWLYSLNHKNPKLCALVLEELELYGFHAQIPEAIR